MTLGGRGRLLVAVAALLWSLGGVLAKEIPLEGAPLAFYRSLIAGLVLWPLAPRGSRVVRPAMVPLALILGAMVGFYLAAVKATTAANAIYLQCSAIFWTIPLAALWLRERVDRRSLAGIGVALVGVGVIVCKGYDGRPGETIGMALGLASGVTYAMVIVGLRGCRDVDPIWLTAFVNGGGALFLGSWIVASGAPIPIPAGRDWPLLLAFGVVQMAFPYVLFSRGLQAVRAPEAALISLLEPALNPLWVWLRQGERPAGATIVGGLFLLAGVAVRYVPRWRTGSAGAVGRLDPNPGADDKPERHEHDPDPTATRSA